MCLRQIKADRLKPLGTQSLQPMTRLNCQPVKDEVGCCTYKDNTRTYISRRCNPAFRGFRLSSKAFNRTIPSIITGSTVKQSGEFDPIYTQHALNRSLQVFVVVTPTKKTMPTSPAKVHKIIIQEISIVPNAESSLSSS